MKGSYTEQETQWLLKAYADDSLSWDMIADEFSARFGKKTSGARLRCKMQRLRKSGLEPSAPSQHGNKQTISQDSWVIEVSDGRITDWREAVDKAGVDLAIWQVDRVVVNGWDVTAKVRRGGEDVLATKQNQQIKIWLSRKIKKPLADAAAALIERMKTHAPKHPARRYKKVKDPCLFEFSAFDAHFGKLAWAPETGENYDLEIAERIYSSAVTDLLTKAAPYN
ncbi:hypothetical protein GF420_12910, partial [candidate division GN15 bacterium]|nr:hypothetical protein [candidate division GN15 bacterium]